MVYLISKNKNMLFEIENGLRISNYYKDKLIGTPMSAGTTALVSGLFVCHDGNVHKAIDILLSTNFDETQHLISDNGDGKEKYQIYVYHYDGANIVYHELDHFLNANRIPKIYPIK